MNLEDFDPSKRFSVLGKSILISGATGSLGKAVAIGLAKGGARLTLADNNQAGLLDLEKDLQGFGTEVVTISCWPDNPENADDSDCHHRHHHHVKNALCANHSSVEECQTRCHKKY